VVAEWSRYTIGINLKSPLPLWGRAGWGPSGG
jgi:hypothetical protein